MKIFNIHSKKQQQPRAYKTPSASVYSLYDEFLELPHLLIGGATGSGKSVLLNGLIYNLIVEHSPFEAQFILIDPKRVELVAYSDLPHCVRYASEPEDMLNALQYAVNEMERRYKAMQQQRIKLFNGPDLYIFIDEMADLMVTQKRAVLPLLTRLGQLGRAARVHTVMATQCVLSSAGILPSQIKVNFDNRVALRTASAQDSRNIIGISGSEALPDPRRTNKAECIFRSGADLFRYDLYMYPDKAVEDVLSWWTSKKCIA